MVEPAAQSVAEVVAASTVVRAVTEADTGNRSFFA
jgi:hypothetical protein